jgi:hypothetical protein
MSGREPKQRQIPPLKQLSAREKSLKSNVSRLSHQNCLLSCICPSSKAYSASLRLLNLEIFFHTVVVKIAMAAQQYLEIVRYLPGRIRTSIRYMKYSDAHGQYDLKMCECKLYLFHIRQRTPEVSLWKVKRVTSGKFMSIVPFHSTISADTRSLFWSIPLFHENHVLVGVNDR